MDYTVEINNLIESIIGDGTKNTTGSSVYYLDELSDEFDIPYEDLLSIKDELIEMINEQEEISEVNFEEGDDFSSASLIIYFHEEYCDCLSDDDEFPLENEE